MEFIPDYEHSAVMCLDIDLATDPIRADLAGQGGRDAVQVRLQSMSGGRSECYITMYLGKVSQRIDKPRPLRKPTGGHLQERELRANVVIDNLESSPEERRRFLERAGSEPDDLWLGANRVRRLTHFQQGLNPIPHGVVVLINRLRTLTLR